MMNSAQLREYYHDIREPIRNIANFLQIIKSEVQDDGLFPYIDTAIDCLSILDSFSGQYFSRTSHLEHCCLDEVIYKIRCVLSSQISERRCRFVINKDLGTVVASCNDVFRIFKNLVENSLKHSTSDYLEIKISSACLSDRVVVMYSDNGKLKDSYRISRALKGTENRCLGLRIVSSLMARNNGNIKFANGRFNLGFLKGKKNDN